MDVDSRCGEREHLAKENPSNEQYHQRQRHHIQHPFAKRDAEVQTFGVVQILDGESVGGSADRSADATNIGSHGNRESERNLALATLGQRRKHRRENRQHHCCRSGVGHKHRANSRHHDEAQKHHFRLVAKRREDEFGDAGVEFVLARDNRQHKAAHKQHNHRVGECRHNVLVRNGGAKFLSLGLRIVEKLDHTLGSSQEHKHNYRDRRSPYRNRLQNPHHSRKKEYRDYPLLHNRDVQWETTRRNERNYQRHQQRNRQLYQL